MAGEKPSTINARTLLIVEGSEDERFFGALVTHLGLRNLQVMGIGGKDSIRRRVRTLTVSPGFSMVVSMGIVRDADDNPGAAFESVCGALRDAGLSVPTQPGTIAGESPAVSVLILPGDNSCGMLEDLCLRAVAEDPAVPCVEQYIECLQKRQQDGCSFPRNQSKARVQMFLASRENPCRLLGEAAEAGCWPWDHVAFAQVKDFITQIATYTEGQP